MNHAVGSFISKRLKTKRALLFALLDSENVNPKMAGGIARRIVRSGADAILVGGSTAINQMNLFDVIHHIKNVVTVPVILFPGNVTGVTPNADAILFMSLLNSDDPYFIIGAQALGALLVKQYDIETLPTGYIIAGEGGAAGFVGRIHPFPPGKPELVALYALAAQYLGMKYVYLEAGSGAGNQVDENTIKVVRRLYDGILMVGGGIRDAETAKKKVRAGADIVVVGNLLETKHFDDALIHIAKAVHNTGR